MKITVTTPIAETARVAQVRGLFDLADTATSTVTWDADLSLSARPWHVGLIVGPSGCGKSTIARHLWPDLIGAGDRSWPVDRSILDAFPEPLGIKEITEILSSVGFASPPAWLRPFRVLSTGQQFRVTLARLIAEAIAGASSRRPIVCDEFTSVVDRTVAQIGSAALQKVIRRKQLQFVAVTCHEDVEAWLNPDWTYRPAEQRFAWRSLRRRPAIALDIVRCQASAWGLFAPHHYLSHALNPSAVCFLATTQGQAVAFSAWLPFFGAGPPRRREHRTVTLPDYQGVGIGNLLSATIASMWLALGYGATSTTTHPAMIQARLRSTVWRMTRAPSLAGSGDVMQHASTRLTAGFEYIGPPMTKIVARSLLAA
jgi:ABC-type lipoprotein export system ATPase subunit